MDKTENNDTAEKAWALARKYPMAASYEDAVKLDAAFAKWADDIKAENLQYPE